MYTSDIQVAEISSTQSSSVVSPSTSSTSSEHSNESSTSFETCEKNWARPKICHICEDKASGYHYDVASCNSCKTFFRRIVLTSKTKVKCKKIGKCNLGTGFPRKCRACRFKKCVESGMNPDAVTSTKQNERQREKNKRQFVKIGKLRVPHENAILPALTSRNLEVEKRISLATFVESRLDRLRCSTLSEVDFRFKSIEDILEQKSIFRRHKNYTVLPKLSSCGCFTKWGSENLPDSLTLNEYRCKRPKQKRRSKQTDWMVVDLVLATEYAKTFSFFQSLSIEDQLALLKGNVLSCLSLSQAYDSYIRKEKSLVFPNGKQVSKCLEVFAFEQKKLINDICTEGVSQMSRLNLDEKEYALLKAIALCHPVIESLSNAGRQSIENERNAFTEALLEFSKVKYGKSGISRFAESISLVNSLINMSQKHRYFFTLSQVMRCRQMDSSCCEYPLMKDFMEQ